MIHLFKVKREELLPALMMTLVFAFLQKCFVWRFLDNIIYRMHGNGNDFIQAVPLSGYDAYTYTMMTDYMIAYEPFRHPLIFPVFYPLYLLNQLLISLTGINSSQFIVAIMLLITVFYSYIFIYRILREHVALQVLDANILAIMLFGFGHSMVSMVSPDLFAFSMMLLLVSLYVAGHTLKPEHGLSIRHTWWLFIPVAGVTLSNGLKIFIYSLFSRGKRFFSPRYLLLAVVLPSLLLLGVAWMQESIRTSWNERVFKHADQQVRAALLAQITDTASVKDDAYIMSIYNKEVKRRIMERYRRDHLYDSSPRIKGKKLGKGQFASWTDVSTQRWPAITENMFGESIQLHSDYLLGDVFHGRPIIVTYRHAYYYYIEALLALLLLIGVWCGRRSRFLWMCMAGCAIDVLLHLVLGFGIDEVYIMTTHWIFILPIAYGFMVAAMPTSTLRILLRIVLLSLSLWLWTSNGALLLHYLEQ